MALRDIGTELLAPSDVKALVASDYAGPSPAIYGNQAGRSISSRVALQHSQAYGGTEAVDWVMNNVRLIMETASNAGYHFQDGTEKVLLQVPPGEDGRKVRKAPGDLAELLKAPNPWFTYEDLIELTIIDQMLVGNAFWLKFRSNAEGKPIALYRLSPSHITVIGGAHKLIKAYRYDVPGAQPVEFKPEDIVHFKLPNPHDPYLGLGLIAGGPRVYDIELNLVESQRSFFARGAKFAGILTSDRTVPDPVLKKIRRTFANLYGGPSNSGQVPVLQRGLTFQSVQSTAADAAFKELSELSRDRINAHFRTNRALFGDLAGTDAKAVREAQRIFDTKTMRPLLNRMEKRISISLTQAWGLDFVIPYEYKMAPEEAIDLATGLGTLPGIRVREVRALAGYEPLGKEIVVPDEIAEQMGVEKGTPVDDLVLNLPGSDKNDSEIKDRNLRGEGGRPPDAENTSAFPAEDAAATGGMGRRTQKQAKQNA